MFKYSYMFVAGGYESVVKRDKFSSPYHDCLKQTNGPHHGMQ